jgi:hypothetical protein
MPPGDGHGTRRFEYRGTCTTGNDTGPFHCASRGPLWVSRFQETTGQEDAVFDTMVFVDDDGRAYAYYSGRHTDGMAWRLTAETWPGLHAAQRL